VKPSAKAPEPKSASKSASPAPLNRLTIQVGAFKERSAAEDIVKRLKGKGYSAYLVPVSEGLFNVRVGSFTNREDAERILAKLETQEKFKPFIVKP
jgi:cell division septation protein DedD